MTTIPIEVIIQDAESPVTPTPESGEETNITVPDTGTISDVGSNSGEISSSASIILPAIIAVLAIGAIVAIIVRRYQKRKNNTKTTKLSRKEKLATAASGTVAILAATVLVGSLVISATKAASDDTSSSEEGTYLETEDKITITATIDKDSEEDIYTVSTKDILYATTDASGYTVTMSMIEGALTSNLYLDGDETSEYYIAPVEENTELTNNTWGYMLDQEAEGYNAVPLADTPATIKEGEEATEHEEIDVYYTVKVNKELPLGTYTGTIEYNIEGNYGFPKSLTTMQGMTHEICESVSTPNAFKADGVTIEDNVPTTTLTDIRDNKTYTVAKLADGKCWMTQNLDLQKEDLVVTAIDNANTDNPAEGFELPDSQNSGNYDWWGGGSETSYNVAHVYDIGSNGQTYHYCLEEDGPHCTKYGDAISENVLGNLYNWYATTAGTGTYSIGSGDDKKATGSICPANWILPNNSNVGEVTDYGILLYLYGILQSPTSASYDSGIAVNLYWAPFFFVPTGRYNRGVADAGDMGSVWSSVAISSSNAMDFFFSVNGISPQADFGKYYGHAVRCVAQ